MRYGVRLSFSVFVHAVETFSVHQAPYRDTIYPNDVSAIRREGAGNSMHRGALHLSDQSPCSPTPDQLGKLALPGPSLTDVQIGNATSSGWSGLKFFLHEDGAFDFSDRVRCFFHAVHSTPAADNLDMRVLPNVAEHTTDVYMLEQLRRHPGRVHERDDADIQIIGSALGTSYHASQLPGFPCGRANVHERRVERLLDELDEMKAGSFFLLIDTDWYWENRVLSPRFVSLMRSRHMMLATVDRDIADYGHLAFADTVIIPYKAHFRLDRRAHWSAGHRTNDLRSTSFTFHGTMSRHGTGEWRGVMQTISDGLPNTSIKDIEFNDWDAEEFSKITDMTANKLLDSAFCFVPAGDTASSRRLFDALAAGCVPIILNAFDASLINLPFVHSIDWTEIAIFGGDPGCLAHHVGAAKAWLQSLWEQYRRGDQRIEDKRRVGRQVYADMLSYGGGNLASAMLAEIGLMRKAHPRRA